MLFTESVLAFLVAVLYACVEYGYSIDGVFVMDYGYHLLRQRGRGQETGHVQHPT